MIGWNPVPTERRKKKKKISGARVSPIVILVKVFDCQDTQCKFVHTQFSNFLLLARMFVKQVPSAPSGARMRLHGPNPQSVMLAFYARQPTLHRHSTSKLYLYSLLHVQRVCAQRSHSDFSFWGGWGNLEAQ